MENKKVIPGWLSVVLVILSVASIVGSVVYLINNPQFQTVTVIILFALTFLSSIAVIFYCAKDYKKEGSHYFKVFMWLFLVQSIVAVYAYTKLDVTSVHHIFIFLSVAMISPITLLGFAENLGKKKSYLSVFAIDFILLVTLVLSIIYYHHFAVINIASLINGVILTVIVFAKYKDKDLRQNKK